MVKVVSNDTAGSYVIGTITSYSGTSLGVNVGGPPNIYHKIYGAGGTSWTIYFQTRAYTRAFIRELYARLNSGEGDPQIKAWCAYHGSWAWEGQRRMVTETDASGVLTTYGEEYKTMAEAVPSLIAKVELTSSQATIDFQNIPADFRHLQLRIYARGDTALSLVNINLTFNNDAGASYDRQYSYAAASSTTTGENLGQNFIGIGAMTAASAGSNLFAQFVVDINHYTNAANNKILNSHVSIKTGTSSGNVYLESIAGFWRSNSAINRITLTPNAGNFVAGTLVELYGLP